MFLSGTNYTSGSPSACGSPAPPRGFGGGPSAVPAGGSSVGFDPTPTADEPARKEEEEEDGVAVVVLLPLQRALQKTTNVDEKANALKESVEELNALLVKVAKKENLKSRFSMTKPLVSKKDPVEKQHETK